MDLFGDKCLRHVNQPPLGARGGGVARVGVGFGPGVAKNERPHARRLLLDRPQGDVSAQGQADQHGFLDGEGRQSFEHVVDGVLDAPWERKAAAASVFLRGMGRGRVTSVTGLHEVHEAVGKWIVEADIPTVGAPKKDGYEKAAQTIKDIASLAYPGKEGAPLAQVMTEAKAEAQLGKVAWLEYTSTTEGLLAPTIEMFQPKPSAEALMSSMGKLVADIAAAK